MIELLIVSLIAAILAVVAVPNGIRQVQLYRLETSVSLVSNELMKTRMSAIKRNRTVWLRLEKAYRTSQIITTDDANKPIGLGSPVPLGEGLVLDSNSTIEIRFDSTGRLNGGSQSLRIKEASSGKRKNINISPSGKITVSSMY